VRDNDLLRSVSFLPYVQRTDGKMDISLKLQLIGKIREETDYFAYNGRDVKDSLQVADDNQTIYNRYYIEDDNKPFSVVKATVEKREIQVTFPLIGKPKMGYVYSAMPSKRMFEISVLPVEIMDGKNKLLAGHRVFVGVVAIEFAEEANQLSAKVREWYDIVPEVSLLNI
jgi:hypothetical protein